MSHTQQPTMPHIIEGGLAVDDRGEVAFINESWFVGIKRFYMVSNHQAGFVRAWHAHRRECKYITAVQGSAIVAAVAIDDWQHPSKDAQVHRYVLSSKKPTLLFIPAGYANGSMSLTADTKLLIFSTATIEESHEDDVRYDARYWDVWQVIER